MFKLLRKYDKWILAIGGSLLMVVFLLPQALQQFGANPRKATVATLGNGGKITEQDKYDAQRELNMLDSMSPAIKSLMLQIGSDQGQDDDSNADDLPPAVHWLLLTREASKNGLIGGAQDGRGFIPVAARFLARQYILQNRFSLDFNQLPDIEGQLIQNYSSEFEKSRTGVINGGIPAVMVDRVLAKARGVLRMYDAYFSFEMPSLQESQALCNEYFDSAEIYFFTVGSNAFIDPAYEPSEDEILAQYALYSEDLPGESEFGFGYRSEDRVRIDTLRIVRQEIADAITIDPVEVNTRWRGDRSTYPGSFVDERTEVEKAMRDEQTDAVLREAEQDVREELLKARGGLSQNDGMYELPADWAQTSPRFIKIAQVVGDRLREKHGDSIPNPVTQDDSKLWRTSSDVRGLPIIGNSTKLIGPNNVPMADLAFGSPEFDPDAHFKTQAGIAVGPLTARQTGDLVFFRVTETSPTGPFPLEEVRAKVIDDIRSLRAYRALQAEGNKIVSAILANGMEQAATDKGATLLKGVTVKRDRLVPIDPATAPPSFELQKINTEAFRAAVIDRANTFSTTDPLQRNEDRDLLLNISLDSRREIAIVGITNIVPLTAEAFRMIETEAIRFNRTRDVNIESLKAWPYSQSQMAARHEVNLIRRSVDDDDEAAGTAQDDEATAPLAEAQDSVSGD